MDSHFESHLITADINTRGEPNYLKEELNQKVDNKNNKNNSSDSLGIGRWPQTKAG